MFPLNAIPSPGNSKFQTFYATGTDWQTWQKPAGCSMVYMFMLGPGGGGGRPPNGATTVGGGGGGSGGAVRALIPASLLPDTLYVQVGLGGAGGSSANSAGVSGGNCFVCVQPDTSTANRVISIAGGSGGLASTTGGSAGAAPIITNQTYSAFGLWYSVQGQAGSNGATAANGGGTFLTISAIITSGGTGGGNGTGAGGNINAAPPFIPVTTGGVGTNGTNGANGFAKGLLIQSGLKGSPLLFTGGAGGGGHTTGTAGKGGDASYGGGGGGGGAASGAGVSGNGGNGGDGLIIIGTF